MQSLQGEEGPIDLCRRGQKLVHDELLWVSEDELLSKQSLPSPPILSPSLPNHSFPPDRVDSPVPAATNQTRMRSTSVKSDRSAAGTGFDLLKQLEEQEKALKKSYSPGDERIEEAGESRVEMMEEGSKWRRFSVDFDKTLDKIPILKRSESQFSIRPRPNHSRNQSTMTEVEMEGKTLVVVETLESVEVKPFFVGW